MTVPAPRRLHLRSLIYRLCGFDLDRFHIYPPRPLACEAPPLVDASTPQLRISLVTPVLNQAAFVGRTIESVLAQDYPRLEYIVQDGGSTDGTLEVIASLAARLTRWRSEADAGQADAINRGFAQASGDIMAWLNADDLLLPGALAAVASFFEQHPEVDVVYGDRVVIDEAGQEIGRWALPPHADWHLSWWDFVPQETLFWRRRIWERVGARLDPSFGFAMDWDLLVRFRDAGARFAHLPRYLGAFRVHPAQKTSAQMRDVGQPEMERIRTRCLGRVPSRWQRRRALARYLLGYFFFNLRRHRRPDQSVPSVRRK
jgi:glycosyltransferase involved in cell wall biosynthesis